MRRFAQLAREPCPPLDELALSVAAEFRPTDVEAARAELDHIAAAIAPSACCGAREQLRRCAHALALAAGLRLSGDPTPEALMIDTVLDRREGHQAVLALIWAEVGRRASVPLEPVAAGGRVLVAHPGPRELLLIDPAVASTALRPHQCPAGVRRLCPHQLSLVLVDQLVDAYLRVGDLPRATRAAEMRLLLPVPVRLRRRFEFELQGIAASPS